jgi:acyl-ACP thioesterase
LWVCVDGAGRPAALDDQFFACYAEAAGGRRVKARLTHAPPGHSAASRPWALRHSDLDVLGHVNNAASWEAVVDEVARCFPGRVVARAEVEHVGPVEAGDDVVLVRELGEGGLRMWLCVGGAVRVSATVSTVPVQESKGPGSAAQL